MTRHFWDGIGRAGHVALLLIVVGALLAACGGAVGPTSAPTVATAVPTTAARPTTSGAPTADVAPKVTGDLTVFAAASLTDAFQEIGQAVEAANPGATISFNFAGSSTMRCTSSGSFVTGRSPFTTTDPMLRFGTKCPSITSTWTRSAPARSISFTCSPSRAKSAARMDGAIIMSPQVSKSQVPSRQPAIRPGT